MERTIHLDSNKDLQTLFGKYDQNINLVQKELKVKILRNSEGLKISGERKDVDKACGLFDYLLDIINNGSEVKTRDITYALKLTKPDEGIDLKKLSKEKIEVPIKGGLVTPKTRGQIEYVEAIKYNDIVFGVGPAGTGKTYLAMAMAVNALKKGIVRRIILTRPAIEAGENLGFLPGDLVEKVLPYLRPL